MANPNILSATAIYGNTAVAALTTVTANVVTNSASSNNVYKLNDVSISNYSSGTITANVMLNRSATIYYLAGNISVPAYSTLVVVGKDNGLYMIEGDVLQANASANTTSHIVSSYEQIS
jgi:hypothetical protein